MVVVVRGLEPRDCPRAVGTDILQQNDHDGRCPPYIRGFLGSASVFLIILQVFSGIADTITPPSTSTCRQSSTVSHNIRDAVSTSLSNALSPAPTARFLPGLPLGLFLC